MHFKIQTNLNYTLKLTFAKRPSLVIAMDLYCLKFIKNFKFQIAPLGCICETELKSNR